MRDDSRLVGMCSDDVFFDVMESWLLRAVPRETLVVGSSATAAEEKNLWIPLRNRSRLPEFGVRLILVHTCVKRNALQSWISPSRS